MGRLVDVMDWLIDGGLSRIVYGLLALILAGAFVANVATNGLFTTLSWIYGFIAVGLAAAALSPRDG